MRYAFERDIYDTIDEFTTEYAEEYNENGENRRGMDFTYKGSDYRMCLETDGYYIYKAFNRYAPDMDFEILAICPSMEDLLVCKVIDNTEFQEIVMDEENTRIYGKD